MHCHQLYGIDGNRHHVNAGGFRWRVNITCDKKFVALIRGAAALDFATVLEQQQQRTGRQPKRVDEYTNEAEADESEVAIAGATDLEVDVQPFLLLIELAAAEALEDSLAHERVCNNDSKRNETPDVRTCATWGTGR